MSLVNEMLNELQKEKQKPANFDGMIAVENSVRKVKWLYYIIFFGLLAIAASYYFSFFNSQAGNALISATSEITQSNSSTKLGLDNSTSNIEQAKIPQTETSRTKMPQAKVSQAKTNQPQEKEWLVKASSASPEQPRIANLNTDAVRPAEASNTKASTIGNTPLANQETSSASKPTKQLAVVEKAVVNPSEQQVDRQTEKTLIAKVESDADQVKPMIKVSRKSLADKKFRQIVSDWSTRDQQANRAEVNVFLQEFKELDSAWLSAVSYLRKRDFSFFQQLLDQALLRFPNQPAFRLTLVKQKIEQNDYSAAFNELQKIDEKKWQQSDFKIAGFLAQKVGDHLSAIRFYNQLLQSRPNQGDINMAVAISLEALNENDLAMAKFQRALEDSSLNSIQRQFIAQRIAVLKG